MSSKIDTLIGALGDFSKALGTVNTTLGQFSSDIKTLYKRAEEDREERRREHGENQQRMADIAQAATASISELRTTAIQRWDETGASVERLSDETKELARKIDGQSVKLDEHAATVSQQQKTISALQMGRGKLLFLASIGLFAITVIGWALESSIHWLIERLFQMKFGG